MDINFQNQSKDSHISNTRQKMTKSVKLADIASALGVSVVTVSKALSGQKGVSEELREKIKSLAAEMGYVPVHTKVDSPIRSFTIGVVIMEHYFAKLNSFYWKMYQELATKAVGKSCFTILEVVSNTDENNLIAPKLLQEKRADGLILIGRPKKEYLKMLYQAKTLPMLFMDFYDDEDLVDSVVSAGFHGMYRMTEYLIKHGHQKLAFVGTLMYTESITDRYYGYCKALLEHHIPVREDWIINDRDPETGLMGLDYELALPKELPTAFVCNNDVAAYALIKQLNKKGIRVPEDVSVVGYDNYLYSEFGESTITTFSVDVAKMSTIAVDCIIQRIENPTEKGELHIVSGNILERDSVKSLL